MTLHTVEARNASREKSAAIWFGKTVAITMLTISVAQYFWR